MYAARIQTPNPKEYVYYVRCASEKEERKLLKLADLTASDLLMINFGEDDPERIPTPPPKPEPEQQPSRSKVQRAVRGFICRVLMGDCTPEETSILPVVLDRLYLDVPEGGDAL